MYREKIFSGREDYEEKNMYTATRVTFPRTQLATLGCGGGRSPEAVNWLVKPRGGRLKIVYGRVGGEGRRNYGAGGRGKRRENKKNVPLKSGTIRSPRRLFRNQTMGLIHLVCCTIYRFFLFDFGGLQASSRAFGLFYCLL